MLRHDEQRSMQAVQQMRRRMQVSVRKVHVLEIENTMERRRKAAIDSAQRCWGGR